MWHFLQADLSAQESCQVCLTYLHRYSQYILQLIYVFVTLLLIEFILILAGGTVKWLSQNHLCYDENIEMLQEFVEDL